MNPNRTAPRRSESRPDLDLTLSAKDAVWREADPMSWEADAAFEAVRAPVLGGRSTAQGILSCEGCDATTRIGDTAKQGYFELHHRDDDHRNNRKENLAVVCPFCHQVHHMGFACMTGRGVLVWIPELSQRTVNRLAHVTLLAMDGSAPPVWAHSVKALWSRLASRALVAVRELGADAGTDVADALLYMRRHYASMWPDRGDLLTGWRLLPNLEHPDFDRTADYWRGVNRSLALAVGGD